MASICVIDTNLIARPTPRRFLMGLSAGTGVSLAITPTVREESLETCMYAERAFIRERAEWDDQYFDLVYKSVTDWFDRDVLAPGGVIEVCKAKNLAERARWLDQLPMRAFKSPSYGETTHDMQIVADALAGGAEWVMTNNCKTMFHNAVNSWALRTGVRNAPFLLQPAFAVEQWLDRSGRTFPDEAFLHQCAINMVMPNTRQSPERERDLLLRFAERLNQTMPAIGYAVQIEEQGTHRDARWELGAKMITEPEWKLARTIESKRMEKMRKARSATGLSF